MKRLTIPTFLIAGALVFSACSEGDSPTELRSAPLPQFDHGVSEQGVVPVLIPGNIPGDATNVCRVLEAEYDPAFDPTDPVFTWLPGIKVDPPINVNNVFGFSFQLTQNGTHLDWQSTGNIMKAVLVKGGPDQNVYLYDPPTVFWDEDLHSPLVPGGTPAISHYTFCYVESTTTEEDGNGCTIGYWKQNHADTWADAGYDPDATVFSVFGSANTTKDVKLIDALDLPGGSGAAGGERILVKQAVAAVLNAAHPDVDYPLDEAEIIAAVNAAIASGDRAQMIALATLLESFNSLGCPIDAHGELIEE